MLCGILCMNKGHICMTSEVLSAVFGCICKRPIPLIGLLTSQSTELGVIKATKLVGANKASQSFRKLVCHIVA
jgi:hypothetical protein